MSIINDALKRAEKNKQLFQNKPQKRWLIWGTTGLLCLLGIIWTTYSFKHPQTEVSSKPELPPSVFPLREIDVETPLRTLDFNLSGILYDSQKPLAIINGRILGEGALINGAELLEIQPNYVKLSLKGEEFTLKIK